MHGVRGRYGLRCALRVCVVHGELCRSSAVCRAPCCGRRQRAVPRFRPASRRSVFVGGVGGRIGGGACRRAPRRETLGSLRGRCCGGSRGRGMRSRSGRNAGRGCCGAWGRAACCKSRPLILQWKDKGERGRTCSFTLRSGVNPSLLSRGRTEIVTHEVKRCLFSAHMYTSQASAVTVCPLLSISGVLPYPTVLQYSPRIKLLPRSHNLQHVPIVWGAYGQLHLVSQKYLA